MKSKRSLVISIILVVLISALYRAMPNRPWGFAPQWAIAIFSGALFARDKKMAFILPLISMFISDLLYQVLYKNGLTVIPGFYSGQWLNYLLFTAMAVYGFLFNTKKISGILGASIAAPTTYFIISNFLVWISGGGWHHPKTMSGLVQCFVDAVPFYTNSLISSIIFSAILFGVYTLVINTADKKQLS